MSTQPLTLEQVLTDFAKGNEALIKSFIEIFMPEQKTLSLNEAIALFIEKIKTDKDFRSHKTCPCQIQSIL